MLSRAAASNAGKSMKETIKSYRYITTYMYTSTAHRENTTHGSACAWMHVAALLLGHACTTTRPPDTRRAYFTRWAQRSLVPNSSVWRMAYMYVVHVHTLYLHKRAAGARPCIMGSVRRMRRGRKKKKKKNSLCRKCNVCHSQHGHLHERGSSMTALGRAVLPVRFVFHSTAHCRVAWPAPYTQKSPRKRTMIARATAIHSLWPPDGLSSPGDAHPLLFWEWPRSVRRDTLSTTSLARHARKKKRMKKG